MNHKGTYIKGKDILMEDLRQKCVFKLAQEDKKEDQWWEYMQYVHRMCYEEITENCSRMGHTSIGRDFDKTMQCVNNTFEMTVNPNYQKDDNKVLKEESIKWKAYGSAYWPALIINERTYRGDLIPDNVVTAICAAFSDEPEFCLSFKQELGSPGSVSAKGVTRNVLIFIVVFLVLLNIGIILLYRRCQNRDIQKNMQMQVNSAVSQYFALSTRNTSMA